MFIQSVESGRTFNPEHEGRNGSSVLTGTVDRLTYSPSERAKVLKVKALLEKGENPFKYSSPLILSVYSSVVSAEEDGFRIGYKFIPLNYQILNSDSDEYIRSLLEIARQRWIDPHNIERQLEFIQAQKPEALAQGKVQVVDPISLTTRSISSFKSEDLPPSGLMIGRSRNPLVSRRLVGYNAGGSMFDLETKYIPASDRSNNFIDGIANNWRVK